MIDPNYILPHKYPVSKHIFPSACMVHVNNDQLGFELKYRLVHMGLASMDMARIERDEHLEH